MPAPVKTRRLLDLFSGAGGAAAGYHEAGFTEIVGVDIALMPRYPFEFIQADALEFLAGVKPGEYDLIHASPPCQRYCGATAWRGSRLNHPDLIGPVRSGLQRVGTPYVIENVPDARRLLRDPLLLCGSMFGLPFRRHRYFEVSRPLFDLVPGCVHQPGDCSYDHGAKQPESVYRDALGCEWMTVRESREAVPPAYTRWIGRRLLE